MQELLHKRSYNAKHFSHKKGDIIKLPVFEYTENPDNPLAPIQTRKKDLFGNPVYKEIVVEYDGQYKTMESHAGHIHYIKNGNFEPLDWKLLWDDTRRGWYFDTHSYNPFLPEYSDGWAEFRDRFHDKDQTVRYKAVVQNIVKGELIDTDETNPSFDDNIDNKGVLYRNAFGENRDYMLYNTRSSLVKVATVNNPNECTADAVFEWEVEFPDKELFRVDKREDAEEMTAKKTKTNTEDGKLVGYRLEKRDGKNVNTNKLTLIGNSNLDGKEWYTYLHSFKAWDSEGNTIEIVARISFVNGKAILKKTIPLEFLKNAVGRVFTDTTTSYYAGAGEGLLQCTKSTWSAARDASTGTGAFKTADLGGSYDPMVYVRYSSPNYNVFRSVYPFPSVNLNSGQTVTAATLYVRGQKSGGANTFVYVVKTNQASTSAIATSDFGTFTLTEYACEASVSTTLEWKAFEFNATGRGYITAAADVKLGIVGSKDYTNTPPTSEDTRMYFYGTASAYDPYLSITYTDGSAAAFVPKTIIF